MRAKPKSASPTLLATNVANRSTEFLLAQYSALRDEILKRMEIQNQIVALIFIASGTILSVGLQFSSITIILATPILTMFLAASWAQHDVRIRQLGLYIKKYIEEDFLEVNKGWEGVGGTSGIKHLARYLSLFASQGIFIGTQVLSILIALLKTNFNTEDNVLLAIDIFIIIITFSLLWRRPVIV